MAQSPPTKDRDNDKYTSQSINSLPEEVAR